jgi:outer membrane protein TolC
MPQNLHRTTIGDVTIFSVIGFWVARRFNGRSRIAAASAAQVKYSILCITCVLLLFSSQSPAEPISLEHAVRLALGHSTTTAIADADVQRAFASYHELRNNYFPQIVAGSGLGWTYGYPLSIDGSAPALFNAVAQSTVYNPAGRQFLAAAKTDWIATEFQNKDQRAAVIQDVALTYSELAKWEARLANLQQDQLDSAKVEQAVAARQQEGVDSAVDVTKAKLISARLRLHYTEARGNADVLRRHLSTLTGLPGANIELEPETIPAFPSLASAEDLPQKAVAASPAIKSAEKHSLAESQRASAERRAFLPSIDFSGQYARFSTFNNYTEYFPNHFQQDNATIGFGIRIPIFNASQHSRADAAEAEAVKAQKQLEAARNQVAEDTLKLQRAAEQLEAAREVADLEYQLAQSSVEAAQTKIDAQTGTWHELIDAKIQANEHFLRSQDADLEYDRARLNLLRATGDLERWALPLTK